MTKTHLHYTNTTPIMSWCSYKIKPRLERSKNQTAPLVLQIFISGKKAVIDLKITTLISEWDQASQTIRGKSDTTQQANFLLANIKAAIHNIQLDARLQNRELTIDIFKDAFLNRSSREDFLQYFAKELQQRYQSGIILHSTYKAQRNTLHHLQTYYKNISFSEINHQFLEDLHRKLHLHFTAHDKRTGNTGSYHTNSIFGHFKVIKTYLRLAARAGIKFQDPFQTFKVSRGLGRIIYLNPQELNKMVTAWRNHEFKGSDHYSLSVFLFACYTSLRISDIKKLNHQDIFQGHIIIRPQKTQRTGKVVRIPLNNVSREIIQGREGTIFQYLAEQKINKHLKGIAAILGINKNISMHVGRHTFATEFLRRGGQIHVLQKIMGHSDIKTTMIYTHLNDEHLEQQMDIMND